MNALLMHKPGMNIVRLYNDIDSSLAAETLYAVNFIINPTFRDILKDRCLLEGIYSDVLAHVFFEEDERKVFSKACYATTKSLRNHGFRRVKGHFTDDNVFELETSRETTEKFYEPIKMRVNVSTGTFCSNCGLPFTPTHHKQAYCSQHCREIGRKALGIRRHRRKSRRHMEYLKCRNCGQTFVRTGNGVKYYCSSRCRFHWFYHNVTKKKRIGLNTSGASYA